MSGFITFEGPDGSGKTTQIQTLHERLVREGFEVLCLREPGGTAIGDQIRLILHDTRNVEMRPNTELLLYSASRAQLVGQVIRPALESGRLVLCDRFAESTLAYQGYGRGLDLQALKAITEFATGGLRPDLIVYLDIATEDGLLRRQRSARAGQGEWNRMDQQDLEFYGRVRAGYLEMAAQDPQRWFVLDATLPIASIRASIWEKVALFLSQQGKLASKGATPRDVADQEIGRGGQHT
jgi:dTMP kinase